MRRILPARGVVALTVAAGVVVLGITPGLAAAPQHGRGAAATPIKHLVVIFQENVSFDHYFGTYPHAANHRASRLSPGRRDARA